MSEARRVQFYSSGLRLAGLLYLPSGARAAPPWPGVVLCNGFTTVKELYLPPLACALAEAGFASLAFDYRGFGESDGPTGRLIPTEQVEDARNAFTFLQSQPEVDAHRVGFFGTSFGGGIAIGAGVAERRARVIISNLPVCHGERWLRGMRSYWEWVEFRRLLDADRVRRVLTGTSQEVDRAVIAPPDPAAQRTHGRQPPRARLPLETGDAIIEFKPEEVVERLSPRPFFMIVAADDTRVPPEVSLPAFERAREPKSLATLYDVEHHAVYEPPARDHLLAIVVPWLKTHLEEAVRTPG